MISFWQDFKQFLDTYIIVDKELWNNKIFQKRQIVSYTIMIVAYVA